MHDDGFESKKNKYWSSDEAVLNIQRYCAFQERCHQEVRFKLIEHSIYGDLLEEIISDLISNNYLDEERYARSYARGKFRIKNWGRNKIKQELKSRNVSDYSIKAGLSEIDEKEYLETLSLLISKKDRLSKFVNQYDRLKKLSNYAISKGYEYHLINEVLQKN